MIFVKLLAIFGLCYFFMNKDGPWSIMARLRNKLIDSKYFGVFFYRLFSCPYCVGAHCGWLVELITTESLSLSNIIVWSFSGAIFSLICYEILDLIIKFSRK